MFIGKPFTDCPKCKKKSAYGLLMVNSGSYTKRCKECWHSENYKLPALNKKIIYLDQFVISNMMKTINEKLGKKDKVDKIFLKLFEELDKMVKLQLIICPDSMYHRDESLFSFYKALKRMYEHLSNGTTFYDSGTIRRFQIDEDFKSFIDNRTCNWKLLLDVDDVLHGDRDEWQGKWLITVDSQISEKEIESFRKLRLVAHQGITEIFNTWRKEKNKSYSTFFKETASSYGSAVVNRYTNMMTMYMQEAMGARKLTADDLFSMTSEESILISSLLRYLPKGAEDLKNINKVMTYLKSDRQENIPINEIYSAIWAAIAYQASRGGRITPPNKGMFNDIEMVATLLPYCDAIFVDKDMHSLMNFGAVKTVLSKYKCKIFSLTNIDDFFEYLEEINKNTSKKHLQTIKDVYGDNWDRPFYEMYDESNH